MLILNNEIEEMYFSINYVLNSINFKKSEPEIVKEILMKITSSINNINFQNVGIKCGGIFVHQTPKVKSLKGSFKPMSVELGDLLIISNYFKQNEKVRSKAVLMQAKKEKNRVKIIPDNEHQLKLYKVNSDFKYTSHNNLLRNKKRSFYGFDSFGLKYLIFQKNDFINKNYNYSVFTAKANKKYLTNYNSFVMEIINLILGIGGRSFSYIQNYFPVAVGSYKHVINDLLYLSKKYWTKNNSKQRSYGELMCFSDFIYNKQPNAMSNRQYCEKNEYKCIEGLNNYIYDDQGISILEFNLYDYDKEN